MTEIPSAAVRARPCPVCDQPVPLGEERCPNPNCQVNLTELAAFDTLPHGLYRAALAQYESGNLKAAVQLLQAALRLDPDDLEAWVVQGKLLARLGQYEPAVSCWQRALVLCPDEPRALAGIEQARRKQAASRPPVPERSQHWHTFYRVFLGVIVGLLAGYLFFSSARPESLSFDQRIHSSPILSGLGLKVEENADRIQVNGQIPDETYRLWIEELARASAPGKKLDTSALQLTAPPDRAAEIKRALANDARTQNYPVQVESRSGGIAVSGSVPDEQALTAVRTVAGASGLAVDTSGLAVEIPKLVNAVQERLAAEKALAGEKIIVAQEDLGIRLTGEVTSQQARDLAEQTAGQVPGVKWVDAGDLKVTGIDLVSEVRGALTVNAQMDGADITVEQVGNGVRLTGKVARPEQLDLAGEIARSQYGVALVDLTGLEVAWQGRSYTVQAGDTLTGIAQKMYGQWWMWSVIVEANENVIKDPRQVPPGTMLLIPRMIPALDRGPYPQP